MPEMKDSGIDWIGKIPTNWSVMPIKYLKANEDRAFVDGPFGSNLKSEHFVDEGDVYVIESGCISTGKFIFKEFKTITNEHFLTINRSECKENDIIIAKIGANYGMAAELPLLDKKSVVSGNSLKLTLNAEKMDNYLFVREMELAKKNGGFISIVNETAQPALSLGILNNYRLVVPPVKEQKAISNCLKIKCDEIDALSIDIQSEIDLLEEYKHSVITEKVTKGLKPDVAMKDSGIEWIGECPDHWQFFKAKYVFSLRNSKGNRTELQLLSPTQKFGVIPQSLFEELTTNTAVKIKEDTDLSQFKTIHKGDFCISLRSFQGGFEYCAYEGVVSPAYQVFYPIVKICDNYYKYLFKERSFINKINSYTLSLRDGKNISFTDFGNTYLPMPPINEQEKIAMFLDNKCAEIDFIIETKKQQLTVLDEYKKAIIYEYVTGKKEVCV